jgi:hypothetical protein
LQAQTSGSKPVSDAWAQTHDRVWLGGEFWANPMEDWRVSEGGVECLNVGPGRSVHSLTHQITQNGAFTMAVTTTRLEALKNDGGAGFRIGVRSEINEHRSNCFVQKGINAGWQGDQLVLGPKLSVLKDGAALNQVRLTLNGAPQGEKCVLTLIAAPAQPVPRRRARAKARRQAVDGIGFKTGHWKARLSPSQRSRSSARFCGPCTR